MRAVPEHTTLDPNLAAAVPAEVAEEIAAWQADAGRELIFDHWLDLGNTSAPVAVVGVRGGREDARKMILKICPPDRTTAREPRRHKEALENSPTAFAARHLVGQPIEPVRLKSSKWWLLFDTLFIDEAGQLALADALAAGTATRNLVLLGDPNQLPQVSQGSHPPGTEASVLGHLLGDDQTVRPEMGLFLAETWRLRPEICSFISEAFYEGRLEPAAVTVTRSVADGNGVRFLQVEHAGHRLAAPEEAEAIRAEINRLMGTPFVEDGRERTLRYDDFIVVAPYNAHVRCLRMKMPQEAVRIGTVDKFQGQEAAVVFYAMASSSSEDVPRGLDFLFSRNRLNVAVSRAQCLAYVVASPRLLEASCKTVEQMRLVNALCRFVEVAEERIDT